MPNELSAAIENAYAVFPEMKWRGRNATVCPCCVSELNARDLARTPRRDLDADLIGEYLGSAHHVDEGSAAQEVRHFLPRIFELVADGEETSLSGNECALTAPAIWGVSDLVLAHPSWPDHGLAWIEAFDEIDLIELAKVARANRKAVPKREAMAAMLYERLAPIFDPPAPRKRAPFKHSRTTPRYARMPPEVIPA